MGKATKKIDIDDDLWTAVRHQALNEKTTAAALVDRALRQIVGWDPVGAMAPPAAGIGANIVKSHVEGGVRVIEEVQLMEVSLERDTQGHRDAGGGHIVATRPEASPDEQEDPWEALTSRGSTTSPETSAATTSPSTRSSKPSPGAPSSNGSATPQTISSVEEARAIAAKLPAIRPAPKPETKKPRGGKATRQSGGI